jgi:hypothetical protein
LFILAKQQHRLWLAGSNDKLHPFGMAIGSVRSFGNMLCSKLATPSASTWHSRHVLILRSQGGIAYTTPSGCFYQVDGIRFPMPE